MSLIFGAMLASREEEELMDQVRWKWWGVGDASGREKALVLLVCTRRGWRYNNL